MVEASSSSPSSLSNYDGVPTATKTTTYLVKAINSSSWTPEQWEKWSGNLAEQYSHLGFRAEPPTDKSILKHHYTFTVPPGKVWAPVVEQSDGKTYVKTMVWDKHEDPTTDDLCKL